jgi:hypothetical protein
MQAYFAGALHGQPLDILQLIDIIDFFLAYHNITPLLFVYISYYIMGRREREEKK